MNCPICGAAPVAKFRPFCSGRCADVDLAKWLNGSYAVPSRAPEDVEAALDAVEAAQDDTQKPH